jgi:hypothetical protein
MSNNSDNNNNAPISTDEKYKKQLEWSKNYYSKNKDNIRQKADERRRNEILELLNNGTRKCRDSTLKKYNIIKKEDGKFVLKE